MGLSYRPNNSPKLHHEKAVRTIIKTIKGRARRGHDNLTGHHKSQMRTSPLRFAVRRRKPELLPPAKPTPRELKRVSDIDDQEALRCQIPLIIAYRRPGGGVDPVEVLRRAVAEALVFYYPLAGRVKEGHGGRRLVVDCNAEGVEFVAAEADVRLEEFSDEDFMPPLPCWEELIFSASGSCVLHSPLLLFQVTRLLCGGVIVGLRLNHVVLDAAGMIQFLRATSEIARGASQPSLLPVWKRELFSSRQPPRVTYRHREYEPLAIATTPAIPFHELQCRSFFFVPAQLSCLRRLVPPPLHGRYSTFDLLTSCLWRCRTIALQLDPNEEVRAVLTVNARTRMSPPLPAGYYGNSFGYSAAVSTAKEITGNSLGYALNLVMEAKAAVTDEHMRSVADLMELEGRPQATMVQPQCFLVSDSRAGFDKVNLGWGMPVYGGMANARVSSFVTEYVNRKGEKGIVVTVCLPPAAMQRFAVEVDGVLMEAESTTSKKLTHSSL